MRFGKGRKSCFFFSSFLVVISWLFIVVADGGMRNYSAASHHHFSRETGRSFNHSEKQAQAILQHNRTDCFLLETNVFSAEIKSLTEQISKLELLSSRDSILQLMEQEAVQLKTKFSDPRRSLLVDSNCGQPFS